MIQDPFVKRKIIKVLGFLRLSLSFSIHHYHSETVQYSQLHSPPQSQILPDIKAYSTRHHEAIRALEKRLAMPGILWADGFWSEIEQNLFMEFKGLHQINGWTWDEIANLMNHYARERQLVVRVFTGNQLRLHDMAVRRRTGYLRH
jgi:hypothetical protein